MSLILRRLGFTGLAVLLGACATKGAVRRVEMEVVAVRTQMARQDSARAAELARVIALQERILDSLGAAQEALRQVRTEVNAELLNVQAQLVQVQELTGQGQRRLSELRRQIDDRMQQVAADTAPPPSTPDSAAPPPPSTATPDQLYQTSLQELRRGSLGTARVGFQEFVRVYPTHALMPDVLYFMAETFAVQSADSASYYYRQVVERFPRSERASTSLFKMGVVAEQQGDQAAARAAWQRVVREYPRSEAADLARSRLAAQRP